MINLKLADKRILEKLFQMDNGYVLDFSNNSFADFFHDSLNVNIYDSVYRHGSGSKANMLRGFWNIANEELVAKSIYVLIRYIEDKKLMDEFNEQDYPKKLLDRAGKIANKLSNVASVQTSESSEQLFLKKEYTEVSLSMLFLPDDVVCILDNRMKEITNCIDANAPLAVMFLCGSTLEGIFTRLS